MKTIKLTLDEGQGTVDLDPVFIESVTQSLSRKSLAVKIVGHMTLHVRNEPGLYANLLRIMAEHAETLDAQAANAAELIS